MPSLLEALEDKYGLLNESPVKQESLVSIYIPKKPARLTVPELLVLNDCDIDTAGDPQDLSKKCSSVKELDLAQNKLSKWEEVFGILEHMPRVEFINLSFNQICGELVSSDVRLGRLRNIVLNCTKVEWDNVNKILNLVPTLEELHLSMNEYKKVCIDVHQDQETEDKEESNPEPCNCFDKADTEPQKDTKVNEREDVIHTKPHCGVKKLHFTGNPVTQWKEICKFGRVFPHLESLVVAECPLKSIEMGDPLEKTFRRSESDPESSDGPRESPHTHFRHLTFLNLNSTEINEWDDIDRLAQFPALRSLRVQNWPLWDRCDVTEHERRQMLLARLPQISTLNGGGTVGDEEREDAERAFIRYYQDRPESDRPERYNELVAVHGKLDPLVSVDLRPEKRVKVTFTCGDVSEVRSVDVYRTVVDLKSRLERLAGLPASKMRLFYVDQDLRDLQGPEEMKFPHKQLYSYNIRSGDEIIIDSKQKH